MPKLELKQFEEIHNEKIKERKRKILEVHGVNDENRERRTRIGYNPRLACWALFIDRELVFTWQNYQQHLTN
jgi:hypothetical protein